MQQRLSLAVISLALSALLAGCVQHACPAQPHTRPSELRRYYASMRRHVEAIRAEARVDQRGEKGRIHGTVYMFVQRPDRVRFDAMTQLGPAAILTSDGARFGNVGFVHGHTWPSVDVLGADVVAMGHEHPKVRLTDEVGGARAERAWLRGDLAPAPFEEHHGEPLDVDGELVVCPAFNDLLGGTWTNTEQGFLAPFLPDGLRDAEAYLLDGTRLGDYERV